MKYYLIFIAAINVITLILYKADKVKAKNHRLRIKESVLLSFGFFGGGAGALLGMRLFHHKTRHWYFWVVNILGLALTIALPIILFYRR